MQNTIKDTIKDPQSLDEILDKPKTRLSWLLNKAKRIQQLDALLREILDPPLNQHCQVMNIQERTAVIAADNATWATKIRYQQRDIINRLHFHQQWYFIQQLEIKVR